jgi:hypothetical protein
MILEMRSIGGIEYKASPLAWQYFDNPDMLDDGCGVRFQQLVGEIPLMTDELAEALERYRSWGTYPLGADFSVCCRLHDMEFVARKSFFVDEMLGSQESFRRLDEVNKCFVENMDNVRRSKIVVGWRKYLMRYRWYERSRDSLLRRIIRLYGVLVTTFGRDIWASKL